MFRSLLLLAAFFCTAVASVAQQSADQPLLIGRVAINQSHIAFTYAGRFGWSNEQGALRNV